MRTVVGESHPPLPVEQTGDGWSCPGLVWIWSEAGADLSSTADGGLYYPSASWPRLLAGAPDSEGPDVMVSQFGPDRWRRPSDLTGHKKAQVVDVELATAGPMATNLSSTRATASALPAEQPWAGGRPSAAASGSHVRGGGLATVSGSVRGRRTGYGPRTAWTAPLPPLFRPRRRCPGPAMADGAPLEASLVHPGYCAGGLLSAITRFPYRLRIRLT